MLALTSLFAPAVAATHDTNEAASTLRRLRGLPLQPPTKQQKHADGVFVSNQEKQNRKRALQTKSNVQIQIEQFALYDGAEFNDPNSYQSRALARTESQKKVDEMSTEKILQYYSLYCIYEATNGVPNLITDLDPRFIGIPFPGWYFDNNWDKDNKDPCQDFYGIECDDDDKVTAIDLFGNILTGSFPPEVMLLASDGEHATGAGNLNRIDLFDNQFLFNNFDSSWMTNLGSNLEYLYLQKTSFAGSLPRLPSDLIEFDCSYSLFSGPLLNETFYGLNNLTYLVLEGNAFDSDIPDVFGQLESLEFLYLSDNLFSGNLTYMEGMPKIVEHWVDYNPGLTGTIPSFIGDLTTLQSFSASKNKLQGTLPSEIGNLNSLLQFWVFGNELTGSIPSELGNLPIAKTLQFEGNMFTGSMPAEVCANIGFLQPIEVLGADCEDVNFDCPCCTCCDIDSCGSA